MTIKPVRIPWFLHEFLCVQLDLTLLTHQASDVVLSLNSTDHIFSQFHLDYLYFSLQVGQTARILDSPLKGSRLRTLEHAVLAA